MPKYDPESCEPIQGFDGLYQVAPDGTVWSLHDGEPTRKRTFPGELGPRVALYRHGVRVYQPYVHVLVRKAFGEEDQPQTDDLAWYINEHYGDHPEACKWLQETLEAA